MEWSGNCNERLIRKVLVAISPTCVNSWTVCKVCMYHLIKRNLQDQVYSVKPSHASVYLATSVNVSVMGFVKLN